MAFVSKGGGAEQQNETAGAGQPIDFDPHDDRIVKVHYDLGAWTFDQHAELAEAMAEALVPHAWDGAELVVPEFAEEQADEIFERVEKKLGPFPVALAGDEESTEFGLDEWSEADRTALTESLVDAEIPHRWEGQTLVVAADAEDAVDDLLDAIESGELLTADTNAAHEPPDGALSTIFLAADKLAKDPMDFKSRQTLISLGQLIDKAHPPYAFSQRAWVGVVAGVDGLVARFISDAEGGGAHDDDDAESSGVAGLAQELRSLLRPFV